MKEPCYRDVWRWSNLVAAWKRARRGKRGRLAAASFERDAAERLIRLQNELQTKRYRPGGYQTFTIRDPKRRLISAAPFRDRIVHHALCAKMEPAFERRFVPNSFASRPGRGTHAALEQCQRYARQYRYVLQCDVEQYFAAVDHAILSAMVEGAFSDPDLCWLCRVILASGEGVMDGAYQMTYFPGDDLFAIQRPRGLPIGNLTSQLWANVYLDALDHFVRRTLRCRAFVRYVDDFLLFSSCKRELLFWRANVIQRLSGLRLRLHEHRCHVSRSRDGIPFLGFVVYPTHRRLKRRTGIAFRRRLRSLVSAYQRGEIPRDALESSVRGWVSHTSHGRTAGLRRAVFEDCALWQLVEENQDE